MKSSCSAGMLLLVLAITTVLSAKGTTTRIVITGSELLGPIELRDRGVVAPFNVWSGPGTKTNGVDLRGQEFFRLRPSRLRRLVRPQPFERRGLRIPPRSCRPSPWRECEVDFSRLAIRGSLVPRVSRMAEPYAEVRNRQPSTASAIAFVHSRCRSIYQRRYLNCRYGSRGRQRMICVRPVHWGAKTHALLSSQLRKSSRTARHLFEVPTDN